MTSAVLLFVLATLAPGYTPYTTTLGATVHWDTDLFCFEMSDAVPATWDADRAETLLTSSVATWGELPCAPKTLRYDGRVVKTHVDPVFGSGNTVVWVRDPALWVHSPSYYALTTLTVRKDDGVILDADLEVNAGGHLFSLEPVCPADRVDLQNTLTHEAGHLMGLDHSTDPSAALFGSAGPGDTFMRVLGADDLEGYCWLAATFPPTGQVSPCDPGAPEVPDDVQADSSVPDEQQAEVVEAEGEGGSSGCGVAFGGRGRALGAAMLLLALFALRRDTMHRVPTRAGRVSSGEIHTRS